MLISILIFSIIKIFFDYQQYILENKKPSTYSQYSQETNKLQINQAREYLNLCVKNNRLKTNFYCKELVSIYGAVAKSNQFYNSKLVKNHLYDAMVIELAFKTKSIYLNRSYPIKDEQIKYIEIINRNLIYILLILASFLFILFLAPLILFEETKK